MEDSLEPAATSKSPKRQPPVGALGCSRRGAPGGSLFFRVITFGPLKYVFKILQKMMAVVGFSLAVEDVGSVDHPGSSPSTRRVVSGKKRLGRLARCLLSFAPQKLQTVLGYPMSKGLGEGDASEEVRQSPNKPCGKGSKRKVSDVDLEEQQSWIEALEEELPEDDEGDATYRCSKSETDSEEYRSKNDTESDLEFEEKDGHVMLKDPVPEDAPQGEPVANSDSAAATEIKEDLANDGAQEMGSSGEEHVTNEDQEKQPNLAEVTQSPIKPCGKSMVSTVDLEKQSWIEALEVELPEDDEGDSTYQCSKSETDSEEYRSKNDTESDLEFEEQDEHVMLKELVPEDAPQGEPVVNSDCSETTEVKEDLENDASQKIESGVEEHVTNGDQEKQHS